MRLIIEEDVKAVAKRVAEYIADRIREVNPTPERPFVLGLPVGGTPLQTYKELVGLHKAGKLSFRNVVTFNMGEYCGLAWNHPGSARSYMWKNFFGHIDIRRENVHILDGTAGDFLEECRKFEQKNWRIRWHRALLGQHWARWPHRLQ
jgi:glucosamine-6-phosphate deaminase